MSILLKCVGIATSDPYATVDGRTNASTGTIQYPSLLNIYPLSSPPNARVRWPSSGTQPPWKVAGVDYAVGPNTNPTKVVGSNSLPSGASITGTLGNSNYITVSSNNVILDGWDFTQQGSGTLATGWALDIIGTGCTVQNCLFGVNSSGTQTLPPVKFESTATGGKIQYCKFSGGGVNSINLNGGSPIVDTAGNGTQILYNWLYQFTDNGFTPPFNGPVTVKYNLFDSGKFDDNSHGDFINSADGTTSLTVAFNTFYQPAGTIPVGGGGNWPGYETCALQSGATSGFGNVTNLVIDSNTCIGVGSTGHRASSGSTNNPAVSCWFELQSTGGGGGFHNISPQITNNYVTQSTTSQSGTPNIVLKDLTVTGWVVSSNINMEDGTPANGTIG